jgi:hypothetical protein
MITLAKKEREAIIVGTGMHFLLEAAKKKVKQVRNVLIVRLRKTSSCLFFPSPCFLFLVVIEFEIRALYLLVRHSTS